MSGSFVRRFALAALVALLPFASASSAPPAESLLPASTCGFLSFPDLPKYRVALAKTAFGKLIADAAMKPFVDAAGARLEKGEVILRGLPGVTLDDITDAATGEAAIAFISETGVPTAVVLVFDAHGATDKADKVLEKVNKRLTANGATAGTETLGADKAAAYALPDGLKSGPITRTLTLRKGDWVIVATSAPAMQAVLDRLDGKGAGSLGADVAYQNSTVASHKELGEAHIKWFIRPLEFLAAERAIGSDAKPKQDQLEVLKKEGFDALRGFGGAARLADADFDFQGRAKLYAPGPFQKAARMLDLPNAAIPDPPEWIPASAGGAAAASVNFLRVFDSFGSLFDALMADGEKGVFEDIVKGLRDDPDGPRVDLRKDLVGAFKSPAWAATVRPKADAKQVSLNGIAVTDEKAVAGSLKRMFAGDDDVKAIPFGTNGAWQLLPQKKKKGKEHLQGGLPPVLTAAKGSFFLLNSPDALATLTADAPKLADDRGYKDMTASLTKIAGPQMAARGFVRTEDWARDAWIELKAAERPADKLADNNVLAMLRHMFITKEGASKSAFDAKLLPEFEKLRSLFTSRIGFTSVTREDGWSLTLLITKP